MSIKPKFKNSEEAKKAGYFSRRHETNKELLEAREKRLSKKSKKQIYVRQKYE